MIMPEAVLCRHQFIVEAGDLVLVAMLIVMR